MSSLISFFESEFNTQREQWENALKAELKLTEVGTKGSKKLLSGQVWPTLSLETNPIHLGVQESWKKAANSYSHIRLENIEKDLKEDLDQGVRNFFFYSEVITPAIWQKMEKILGEFSSAKDLDVFVLGEKKDFIQSSRFKLISNFVSGKVVHDLGGHSIQELALLTLNFIQEVESSKANDIFLGVYLDAQFFHNIAKVRAAKLLAHKVLEKTKSDKTFKVVGLVSFREWTLYERYSNMLRNEASVASAYIGGADHIQSAGYNTLIELESVNCPEDDHIERSRRMARNTSHVLALESMLGVVEDAAFGSYHLENLTEFLASESWKLMQSLLSFKGNELQAELEKEVSAIREKRLDMVKTRKHVMSGMNDYPDVKEELHLKLKAPYLFRVARIFEDLRLKVESWKNKPEVYIALFGDYGALNARVNFVKNYFELLGLKVHDPGHSELDLENFKKTLSSRKETIIAICALDDQYETIKEAASQISNPEKFIAGKIEMSGFQNLFGGQNVYEVLHNLVTRLEGRKS